MMVMRMMTNVTSHTSPQIIHLNPAADTTSHITTVSITTVCCSSDHHSDITAAETDRELGCRSVYKSVDVTWGTFHNAAAHQDTVYCHGRLQPQQPMTYTHSAAHLHTLTQTVGTPLSYGYY